MRRANSTKRVYIPKTNKRPKLNLPSELEMAKNDGANTLIMIVVIISFAVTAWFLTSLFGLFF